MPDTTATASASHSPGNRPRSQRTAVLLSLSAGFALLGSWLVSIEMHYREQMTAIAALERLGGAVIVRSDTPAWV